MSTTKIEWATDVWNPVTGCTEVSAGCKNCYAKRMHKRMEKMAPQKYSAPFHTVQLHPEVLEQPLKWRKHKRVFVNSMSDLFHEDVPFTFIRDVFGVMQAASGHVFMILTKRPARMLEFMNWWRYEPLPNVWLGVSVEDQATANERIPLLLQTPAAIRFLSCEPLLEFIDLELNEIEIALEHNSYGPNENILGPLHWVIAGGESGKHARPMHPDWVRGLRYQCHAANVPFFFKQWGEWMPIELDYTTRLAIRYVHQIGAKSQCMGKVGKTCAGRLLDGAEHNALPEKYWREQMDANYPGWDKGNMQLPKDSMDNVVKGVAQP